MGVCVLQTVMPFNDALLKNVRFGDFDYRLKADVGQAEYFVSR